MSIYRLPLGQYGYTGHVINLPQDVVSFANSLPRVPSELDVLVIRKDSEQSHRDFRVRRSVVQEALTWLLENNRYYRANAIRLNEEALHRLPQDGNLTDMRSLQLGESSTYECEPSEDLYGAHLSTSFVPNATQQRTEQETVQQSIQDLQSGHPYVAHHWRSTSIIILYTTIFISYQIINLQVKLTPYNLIYLAHARPKHVVHATSIRCSPDPLPSLAEVGRACETNVDYTAKSRWYGECTGLVIVWMVVHVK